MLLLLDTPAFAYSFFGAIKTGAVPIPINTLWKAADYAYVLRDSGARVVDRQRGAAAGARRRFRADDCRRCGTSSSSDDATRGRVRRAAVGAGSADARRASRRAATRRRSGCTPPAARARPKGCVHLQHDMVVCAELFAKGVLGITAADRCFSVAKLFFAYGSATRGYFPLAVGATSILWPGPPRRRTCTRPSSDTGRRCSSRCRPATRCCSRTTATFDLSSLRLGRLGRRSAPAGDLRAIQAAVRRRHPRRHRVDRGAAHVHLEPARPDPSGLERRRRAAATTRGSSTMPACRSGRARSATSGLAAIRRARSTGTSTRRRKDTIQGEWLRTGDKYTRDADGYFWYAGRSDDMLKVGGLWVSPVEVENALIEHPAVQECGVVGREDRDGAHQAGRIRRARIAEPRHAPPWRPNCSSSSGSASPSTSGRAGWSSCPSCPRPPRARFSDIGSESDKSQDLRI